MILFVKSIDQSWIFDASSMSHSLTFLVNTFIIAHLIGFEEIHTHAKNQNLFYEISPPQLIDVERLKHAIDQAGAERVILGSDTPYGKKNLQMNLKRIDSLDISEQEKKLIKGENMQRLINQAPAGRHC
jgi:uncharacterized protein